MEVEGMIPVKVYLRDGTPLALLFIPPQLQGKFTISVEMDGEKKEAVLEVIDGKQKH